MRRQCLVRRRRTLILHENNLRVTYITYSEVHAHDRNEMKPVPQSVIAGDASKTVCDVVGWVRGVTCLDNVMYIVCDWSSEILAYSTETFQPLDVVIQVDGLRRPSDIVVCREDRQLFVGDCESPSCVFKVSADDHSHEKWLPTPSTTDLFNVDSLSLRSRRLLVTSSCLGKLLQFDPDRRRRDVQLPKYMKELHHAVETSHETFVLCYKDVTWRHWSVSKELFCNLHVMCFGQ